MKTENVQQLHNKAEKKVILMRKSHSPHEVKFKSDSDPHFVNVEILKRSTGEVRGQHLILKSDMPQWVGMYESDGFTIVEHKKEVNG